MKLFSAFGLSGCLSVAALLVGFAGCSSERGNGFGADEADAGSREGGPVIDPRGGDAVAPCVGIECQRPENCSGGSNKTTVRGTVFAPNGIDPIYNALVFVPNGELVDFSDQITCETCERSVSGNPVSPALTDTAGNFLLENMPAGEDIPLVVQVGRFRRTLKIPAVKACEETVIPNGEVRLPRNKSEGDIPRIAIVTSTYDPTECILKQIGIDASEFTAPSGNGRVHIYHGNGNTITGAGTGDDLWNNPATMNKYQLIALPCSSYPNAFGGPSAGMTNLHTYANLGGRLFITDLSYPVVSQNGTDWAQTGDFSNPSSFNNPAQIDTSFPKGQALSDWLQNTGATTGPMIPLQETYSRVGTIRAPAQKWLYSGSNTQSYTFNTPVTAPEKDQCGRVYYSSFHIGSGRSSTGTFPSACRSNPLSAQEKVLEFMLFDLVSCVLSDARPPVVPR